MLDQFRSHLANARKNKGLLSPRMTAFPRRLCVLIDDLELDMFYQDWISLESPATGFLSGK